MNGGTNTAGTSLIAVRASAQAIFDGNEALGDGWVVRGIRRLDHRTVMLDVGPEEGPGIALEWIEPAGEDVQSFLDGDVYAVAYRRAPDAWDLDADDTPEDVKRWAAAACKALVDAPIEGDHVATARADHAREAARQHPVGGHAPRLVAVADGHLVPRRVCDGAEPHGRGTR